jgi:hypothetical protein
MDVGNFSNVLSYLLYSKCIRICVLLFKKATITSLLEERALCDTQNLMIQSKPIFFQVQRFP